MGGCSLTFRGRGVVRVLARVGFADPSLRAGFRRAPVGEPVASDQLPIGDGDVGNDVEDVWACGRGDRGQCAADVVPGGRLRSQVLTAAMAVPEAPGVS